MSTKLQTTLRKRRQHLRKPGVVVDKSYLHAFSRRDAEELNGTYLILMSETLLYEVCKDSENRSRLLKNVRRYSSEFACAEHYHKNIEYERRHARRSPPPSHFLRDRDYTRLDLMVNNVFEDADEIIQTRRILIDRTVESIIVLAKELRETYSEAFSGRNDRAAQERAKLEESIAEDREFVRSYLVKNAIAAVDEGRKVAAKIASKATEQWAHYRVAQAVLLVAVDVAHRQNLRDPIAEVTRDNIRHDVLDSQILTLATLVGRIATRDDKIKKWWKLLMKKPVDFGEAP